MGIQDRTPPTAEEYDRWRTDYSNWGRWGADDELGTLNFVTPEVRRDVEITIDNYDDVWIPSVGYLTDLQFTSGSAENDGDNLRYNNSTGTAVLTSGLSKGDSYTLDAIGQRVITPAEVS